MPAAGDSLMVSKIAALAFVVLGFLLAASGYRGASTGYLIAGIVLVAIGIALFAWKVMRRNP
jgi:Na+/melibiose symporter-like transporter